MNLSKQDAEFLCVALQWAEQWQDSIADSYHHMPDDPAFKKAVQEAKRCNRLYEKVRRWLHSNGGRVQLTFGKHWAKVSKDMKTMTIDEIAKLHNENREM